MKLLLMAEGHVLDVVFNDAKYIFFEIPWLFGQNHRITSKYVNKPRLLPAG